MEHAHSKSLLAKKYNSKLNKQDGIAKWVGCLLAMQEVLISVPSLSEARDLNHLLLDIHGLTQLSALISYHTETSWFIARTM